MPAPLTIRALQEQAQASFLTYGPAGEGAVELVEGFGQYHAEYAAIRRGVGLLDLPMRALLRLTGKDTSAFLHRLLTQDIRAMQPGDARRAFLLTTKGRILADLWVLTTRDALYLETDRPTLPTLRAELDRYLFTDDVKIEDLSDSYRLLALHGPSGPALLTAAGAGDFTHLAPGRHAHAQLADACCSVHRCDLTGSAGLHLWVPSSHADAIYSQLAHAVGGLTPELGADSATGYRGQLDRAIKGRGVGWLAFNTARIEAGQPLWRIDFGPDSLPAETGILTQAVSFTKGCYPGQEVVCRMKDLGHPARVLVSLRGEDDRLPIAGSEVAAGDDTTRQAVGAVTSSAVSPLAAGVALAFSVVKWGRHQPGQTLWAPAEGAWAPMKVADTLHIPALQP
jgi:folate-binding protein YgfZ